MDDEGDFKKARGFLLTYSALVLALWYFGADLTQFKLMGNEIKLHQRTESVWLVLAVLNAYFWFRFYQHIPTGSLYFDEPMDALYEESMQWFAMTLKRGMLKRKVADEFASRSTPAPEFKITSYRSEIAIRPSRNRDQESTQDGAMAPYTVKVVLIADHSYRYGTDKDWTRSSTSTFEPCILNAIETWPLKAFTIFRGAFITPWFTDYVAPLLLGGISTGFALWKWCDMNFFTTTLPHIAQSCAGVTH